jgi:hypothetical protein
MHHVGVVDSSFPCRFLRPKTPFRAVAGGEARSGLFGSWPWRAWYPSSASHRPQQACRSPYSLARCHLSAEIALPEQMASQPDGCWTTLAPQAVICWTSSGGPPTSSYVIRKQVPYSFALLPFLPQAFLSTPHRAYRELSLVG